MRVRFLEKILKVKKNITKFRTAVTARVMYLD